MKKKVFIATNKHLTVATIHRLNQNLSISYHLFTFFYFSTPNYLNYLPVVGIPVLQLVGNLK